MFSGGVSSRNDANLCASVKEGHHWFSGGVSSRNDANLCASVREGHQCHVQVVGRVISNV